MTFPTHHFKPIKCSDCFSGFAYRVDDISEFTSMTFEYLGCLLCMEEMNKQIIHKI